MDLLTGQKSRDLLTGQKSRNLRVHFKDRELIKEYLLQLGPFQRTPKNLFLRVIPKIVLIDRKRLVELMIDHNMGVGVWQNLLPDLD